MAKLARQTGACRRRSLPAALPSAQAFEAKGWGDSGAGMVPFAWKGSIIRAKMGAGEACEFNLCDRPLLGKAGGMSIACLPETEYTRLDKRWPGTRIAHPLTCFDPTVFWCAPFFGR